ncbi:hypothetical protein ACQ1Z2_14645, partial [Enterococcus faecalis]|uniref:hypothetical protein n=1 Tax=Enterococcus faecalis TaxID=1351 RepID=UPI003D6B1DF9
TLLSNVRATGRDGSVRARLAKGDRECVVAASQFRQENATLFLVRLSSQLTAPQASALKATSGLLEYFDAAPDALVITGHDGRIVKVNPAFTE